MEMKRRLRRIAIVLAVLAAFLTGLHIWLIDGIGGLIWGLFFREDTVFAAGYTDSGWRSVRVGMTEDDVTGRIGEPLQVWTNQDASVGMRWSKSPGDTHYRCRFLQFNNGRVSEKHAKFYVD